MASRSARLASSRRCSAAATAASNAETLEERDLTVTSSKVILACSLDALLLLFEPAHAANPPIAATRTLSDRNPAICDGSTGQVY
nr:MAG TPA: hypothetical protein [Caudoviricetes sp.]